MKISCIYKITNLVNGKVYIGQTTNYNKRRTSHFAYLRNNTHANEHLQKAFNKYGEDKFVIEIVKECKPEELDFWEINYINTYKACNKKYGYNLINGGQVYRHHSSETRKKISEKLKGRKFSEEHKNRIKIANNNKIYTPFQKEMMKIKQIETRKKRQTGCGEKNGNAVISDRKAEELLLEVLSLKKVIVRDLAQKYNVNESIVYNLIGNVSYKHILQEHRKEIKAKHKNYNLEKQQEALKLLNEGYSQNQIAHMLHISRNTIKKLISD